MLPEKCTALQKIHSICRMLQIFRRMDANVGAFCIFPLHAFSAGLIGRQALRWTLAGANTEGRHLACWGGGSYPEMIWALRAKYWCKDVVQKHHCNCQQENKTSTNVGAGQGCEEAWWNTCHHRAGGDGRARGGCRGRAGAGCGGLAWGRLSGCRGEGMQP